MAGYMGAVDVFRGLIPAPALQRDYPTTPQNNFIDTLVNAKLQKLNIVPNGTCSDAEFLRRAYLDIIGTLPASVEARDFLDEKRSDRRARLVEGLLERPEYADYWALKWADLLRVDRLALGHKGAYEYYRWIRNSFSANKPLDQFARELITAEGPLEEAPAGQFYRVADNPGARAAMVSQVFLGVRIECAQCHHHPYDRWSQTDYYGMQAFFAQLDFKKIPQGEAILASKNLKTIHPRTNQEIYAHPLAAEMPDKSPEGDRRKLLADWMTAPDNRWFAHNLTNRAWAHFMGRGLIEPVDDVRLTNPASNQELLEALAQHLIQAEFDFKTLIRLITASQTYQRSSRPNETNQRDEQNYSRFPFKQLEAEVLLDAVCQTTGVPEKFRGVPRGYRAIQLWDSQVSHYFLKLFGRPARTTACECERVAEPTVGQVLHVMNSPEIQQKLSHAGGRISKLVRNFSDNDYIVDELYLSFFSRYPSGEERKVAREYLSSAKDRHKAAEDLAWSMMNSLDLGMHLSQPITRCCGLELPERARTNHPGPRTGENGLLRTACVPQTAVVCIRALAAAAFRITGVDEAVGHEIVSSTCCGWLTQVHTQFLRIRLRQNMPIFPSENASQRCPKGQAGTKKCYPDLNHAKEPTRLHKPSKTICLLRMRSCTTFRINTWLIASRATSDGGSTDKLQALSDSPKRLRIVRISKLFWRNIPPTVRNLGEIEH